MEACVNAIEHVVKTRGLVLDAGGEIFEEYARNLSLAGQPGVGDGFLKWVYDNQWEFNESQRVAITKKGNSYKEFPENSSLDKFDPSDRKFVAVANAHAEKPPILQATDKEWWRFKEALSECGISVRFLCEDYVKGGVKSRIGKRKNAF